MKNVSVKEKSIWPLKSKVLIAMLVLALIVGLGTAVQAVPGNGIDRLLSSQTAHFNPFTLTVTNPFAVTATSDQLWPSWKGQQPWKGQPPWIPHRRGPRSPFRPPSPPGPPFR